MTSTVAQACGKAIPPSVIQQDAEARLRGEGITVSKIHNAQLGIDVDCVALTPRSPKAGVVLNECLGFSEVIAASDGRATLATTWRNCQSITCGGKRCQPSARSGLQGLITTFVSELHKRHSQSSIAVPPILAQPQATVVPAAVGQQSFTRQSPSIATYPSNTEDPQRVLGFVVFYALYIMTCVTVLVYWQYRNHYYRIG